MPTMSEMYVRFGAALVLISGCVGEISSNDSAVGDSGEECILLDFETDGDGNAIAPGDVVEDAYLSLGITVDVWDDAGKTDDGLGVSFDSANPTGGDDDLRFTGLGNLLINQEDFDNNDISNGFVSEPDDEACGALFEFRFDDPVCVKSLVLLDIDFGEDPAVVDLFDSADGLIATHSVNPMGDNVRLDVALPATAQCNVSRMTVLLSSSGAMDNVEICRTRMEPEIWTQVFDGGGDDVGNDVATDSARNVIVAGTAFNGANDDGLVRKYDASGALLWSKEIDNGDEDAANGVAVDAADQIIVVGSTFNGSDRDLLVRKLDQDGTEVWTRIFDGGGQDAALGVAVDSSDNILVTGFVSVGGGSDIVLRKYDGAGNTLWTRTANVGAQDAGHGVATDGTDVYVAAQVDNGSDFDLWVRKYDGGGTEQWTRVFDGGGDDGARGVAVDSSGNPIVVGLAWNGANSDVFVRKFDDAGNITWTQTFDNGGVDVAEDVATDAAGNIVVTGHVQGVTIDGWTRKYDPTGTEVWTKVFDRAEADEGRGVAVDIAGSVISTGFFDNGSDFDLWVEKYRP